MTRSDPTLLALHGLRLSGLAPTDAVASYLGVDHDRAEGRLEELAAQGYVRRRPLAGRPVWTLTPAGRTENERLLADELTAAGAKAVVDNAYRRFLPLNDQLLETCRRWQVVDPEAGTLNDHHDPGYDSAVIARLVGVDDEIQPIVAELERVLDRFARYRSGLGAARRRVEAGQIDWFTKPTIASYHTLWFELHEDLLATLGLDRAAEATAAGSERARRPPSSGADSNR